MKTKSASQPRLGNNLIRILLLASHFSPILCRPQSHGHHPSPPSGSNRIPHSYDLNITDAMAKFGKKPHKNIPLDNPIDLRAISLNRFDHDTRPIDGDGNDSLLSSRDVTVGGRLLLANRGGGGDDSGLPDWTTHGDVYYDASDGFEEEERNSEEGDTTVHLSSPRHADMNGLKSRIWRRRRQRSSPNPDHRWRRRHRLLLKTRDHLKTSKDHLSGGRRRDRLLLKSDGPGHVVFKAGEVKKDWCRTIPFEQNVTAGRCSKTVRNNLCYGQCNSFFIPQSEKGSNKVAFQSFSFCKPHRLRWVNVTLDCPSGRHSNKVVQKTILKVESCRCIAADRNEMDKNLEYLRKGAKHVRVNQ